VAVCSLFHLAKEISMTSLRQRMIEDLQVRNLAANTQDSYVRQVSLFARYFNQSPELLGPEQIRALALFDEREETGNRLHRDRRFRPALPL